MLDNLASVRSNPSITSHIAGNGDLHIEAHYSEPTPQGLNGTTGKADAATAVVGGMIPRWFIRMNLWFLRYDLAIARSTGRNPDNIAAISSAINEWELLEFKKELV
jgi:hypothetical protein